MIELLGIEISQQDLLLGMVTGLTYAAFAAGFMLVYRSTGTLNFAHGEIGAFSVAVFVLLNVGYGVNWWLSFVLCILLGAAIGMVVELVVIRRLFSSPRLVVLIATIGVGTILAGSRVFLPQVITGGPIPLPFKVRWEPTNDLRILEREVVILLIIPVLVLGLALFLTRTRFGLAVRASASNPDTARVYGISPKTTSTIVWVIAGAFAAATAILFAPLQGINSAQAGTAALGPPLLLRALVVSLLARMTSIPRALAAGVGVGIIEQIVLGNVESTNRTIVELYIFVAVLLIVVGAKRSRRSDDANWSLSPKIKPIPARLQHIWWVRSMPQMGFGVLFGGLALLPLVIDEPSTMFTWSGIMVFAMVAYSLTVLTGWSGQLSLAQFAFVGLGGLTMLAVTSGHDIPIPFDLFDASLTLPWAPAIVLAVAAGALSALVVGLPAQRVKGLFLSVTTLAFAVAASAWLFNQSFFTGDSTAPRPPAKPVIDWGPIEVDFNESRRSYYYLVLVCLGLIAAMVARIRRTGLGRSFIAVRENEDMAAASAVSPTRMKLTGFAISGGIAAFGGALFVSLQPSIQTSTMFAPLASLDVVIVSIIGGLGSIAGPLLGSLWVKGINAVAGDSDLVRLITSDIGLLILLMYFPGGLIQVVYGLRDLLLGWADRRLESAGVQVAAIERRVPTRQGVHREPLAPGVPALLVEGVTVRFGGNVAVDDASFRVEHGELIGLIGTNGAGKSTLLNAISGFVPSTGRIEVLGRDVTALSAVGRHRVGLGRGFQAARLYPELTVRDTVMVALEAREPSLLVPSLTGLPPSRRAERAKRREADELVDYLGLGRYADHFVETLSTGTRRIVELGCLLAVDARVLLLDEPTGGVAQRETEAFGPLIKRIQRELDASVVVIEHDMPLVMSISDRVYCLEAGRVIAEGTPAEVRNNPLVIASYLGTDNRAIERSGARSAADT